jgi:AcrR family transcriptional regulator
MPKGFSEREKEILRERLVEKGKQLFEIHGLRKTSVEDLTRAAGISKGAFYLFFESKEALFFEIVEQFEARFRAGLFAQLSRPGYSPRDTFKQLLTHAFTAWRANPLFRQLNREEYDYLLRKLPEGQIEAHLQQDDVFVAELMTRLRAAGVPIRGDPQTIAGLMKALFFVTLHEEEIGAAAFPATLELLIDLVTSGLVPETEQRNGQNDHG